MRQKGRDIEAEAERQRQRGREAEGQRGSDIEARADRQRQRGKDREASVRTKPEGRIRAKINQNPINVVLWELSEVRPPKINFSTPSGAQNPGFGKHVKTHCLGRQTGRGREAETERQRGSDREAERQR